MIYCDNLAISTLSSGGKKATIIEEHPDEDEDDEDEDDETKVRLNFQKFHWFYLCFQPSFIHVCLT